MTRHLLVLALVVAGCGGAQARGAARGLEGAEGGDVRAGRINVQYRCQADTRIHETSEYDTSGDEVPDVHKVFLRVGVPPAVRLVLICREADLNADGVKDVVRYYNDEGRPVREESDRDFNGQMDQVVFFEEGRIIRMEQDTSGDGRVDTKIFYEEGNPVRAERDMNARSTATRWQPDRWEYYQRGRMVRMGNDIDGDGQVDRWDRDEIWRREQEAVRARQSEELMREQDEDLNEASELGVEDPAADDSGV